MALGCYAAVWPAAVQVQDGEPPGLVGQFDAGRPPRRRSETYKQPVIFPILHGMALRHVEGVVYLDPFASRKALDRIRRFVSAKARGNVRWGHLYRYPMIEFDNISDLMTVKGRFARAVEAYEDLSGDPEPAESETG